MATMESAMLSMEVLRWASNVRRNMRDNAQAYKAQLVGGTAVAEVATVMTDDAGEYLKTIGGLQQILGTPESKAKLIDGLSVYSIDITETEAEFATLETASIAQRDAPKKTAAEINTAADAVLAAVAPYELPQRLSG